MIQYSLLFSSNSIIPIIISSSTKTHYGANDRNRTCDLLITNQLHYRLCYIGILVHDLAHAPIIIKLLFVNCNHFFTQYKSNEFRKHTSVQNFTFIIDYYPYFVKYSSINLFRICGFPFPFISFIHWPTKNPSALSFPFL